MSLCINELAVMQNCLQKSLTHLINGQARGHKERLWALARPEAWRRRQAEKITAKYEQLSILPALDTGAPVEVEIPLYQGSNRQVHRMMEYLDDELGDDLLGAYVHGSLGSYEEIAYSDFDALVILNEDVLYSPERLSRTIARTTRAQAFMLEQDPLQHHGWFVLTPYDLTHFCDAYFPAVLFRYAKTLLHEHGKLLTLFPRDSHYEARQSFDSLAVSVLRNLSLGNYRFNLYRLKGLLSQFMLLPALYVHVRDGKGVWKADSFELARVDFEPDVWAVMDRVSTIRRDWTLSLSHFLRLIAKMPPSPVQKMRRWSTLRPPDIIRESLDGNSCSGMKELIRCMIQRLSS